MRTVTHMTTSRRVRILQYSGAGSLLVLAAACGSSSPSLASPSSPAAGPSVAAPTAQASAPGDSTQAPVPVESNPPGDIPDNLAFLPYRNATAGYSFTHPEGWAESETGTTVTFTDKLNGITADTMSLPSPLTVEAVKQQQVPRLQQSQPAFELRSVEAVTLPAGPAVKVIYRRNSAPDPVTGRQIRDEVEQYLVGTDSRGVRLALFGPVGSDNVDAYRTISQSLTLS